MNVKVFKNDFLLILTALIWGFAFTAQRAGMEYVGPFTYNGVRFLLGALSLVPVYFVGNKNQIGSEEPGYISGGKLVFFGFLAGLILFGGASFQQIGIVYTTAGKAGFITGLYVVLVPLLGMFFSHTTGVWRWTGVALAVAGLYFLSVTGSFTIEKGDFLVLVSAFFWASHVLLIARISPRVNAVLLSIIQYLFCAFFSLGTAFFTETMEGGMILQAWLPIVYGGVCSVGIAYTLQVVAQRKAHPAHAAIILSLEGVFAVLGGFLILGERLLPRGILGCALMFAGMLVSQGETIFGKRDVDMNKRVFNKDD